MIHLLINNGFIIWVSHQPFSIPPFSFVFVCIQGKQGFQNLLDVKEVIIEHSKSIGNNLSSSRKRYILLPFNLLPLKSADSTRIFDYIPLE